MFFPRSFPFAQQDATLGTPGATPARKPIAAGAWVGLAVGLGLGLAAGPAAAAPVLWTYQGAPLEPTPSQIDLCGLGDCEPPPAPFYTAWLSVDPARVPGGSLSGLRYNASWSPGYSRDQSLTTSLGTQRESCDLYEAPECLLALPNFLDFAFADFTPDRLNTDGYDGDTAYSVSLAFDATGALSEWLFEIAGNYQVCNFGMAIASSPGTCGEAGAYDIYSQNVTLFGSKAPGVWAPSPVPLPASALLLGGGIGVLVLRAARRQALRD